MLFRYTKMQKEKISTLLCFIVNVNMIVSEWKKRLFFGSFLAQTLFHSFIHSFIYFFENDHMKYV